MLSRYQEDFKFLHMLSNQHKKNRSTDLQKYYIFQFQLVVCISVEFVSFHGFMVFFYLIHSYIYIYTTENEEGTNLEDVPEQDRKACCLTDEMALRLGSVAVKVRIMF